MIQQMLAIWSLVPLPFLNPAWTSGSSWFMYCWSLAWRILSITLLVWDEYNCAVVGTFFGIAFLWDWNELAFSSPMATAEFSKLPDTGKGWRQEDKGTTEDEMVGWHHWLDGHEFEQAPGVGDGQGILGCCSPWGHKESDTTEWFNWTELAFFSNNF